jgi:quinol monooxygenase YgiN
VTVLLLERYPVEPARSNDFEQLVAVLLAGMRSAPGALWADVTRVSGADPAYLLLAEWRTEPDADAWSASAPSSTFAEQVDALLAGEITRRRFVSPA